MAASEDGSDSVPPSLPPPCPKSPPEYPDLYGKRRAMAKVQVLEREIGFLEEELKSVDSLQSASTCCKEIVDFVTANSDPLIPTPKRKLRRSRRFWKWLCGLPCFNLSWIYCRSYSGCAVQIEMPSCCKWSRRSCYDGDGDCFPACPSSCLSSCTLPTKCLQWRPKWRCCPRSRCCKNLSFCGLRRCLSLPAPAPALPSCCFPTCNSDCKFRCSWRCPKCPPVRPSSCLPCSSSSSSCCSCCCCFNPCHYLCY